MHKRLLFGFITSIVLASGALASDKTDVMKVVNQWDEGFNSGDVKQAAAACAEQTSIIDDFPPHEWHGPGGCTKWMNDAEAFFKQNEISNVKAQLGKPRHVDVSGDAAYVVVSGVLSYTQKDKPVTDKPATVTMALQKTASGWRITGWSWADG